MHLRTPTEQLQSSLDCRLLIYLPHITMNWTGGRLQRNSNNRSGNLARNQKQKFAKSRLRSTNDSRQTPSLIEFATFGPLLQAKFTGDETQRLGLASQVGCLLLEPDDCVAPRWVGE